MDAFIVELKNQPGTFGKVADAIAARGVNVMCAGAAFADFGIATYVADDSAGLRSGLEDCGADFRSVPAIKVRVDNRPGSGAELARILSDAGVNLDVFMPIEISADKAVVAIGCEKIDRARTALGDRVIA
ncbi:MAG: hypothetical protein ABI912_00105 [Actinomycetota bacterium]